ncbi:hypothetical protein EG329_012451 [Mollisiaceae sp. DMI_Dod_QoI]|nr:hypothetical protein EG329_012451 [Helotiales sp. DMI_Dod_QoI]
MLGILVFALLLLVLLIHGQELEHLEEHQNCNIDVFHAQDSVNGPILIDTSPLTPFESPRLSAVNYTAWEQWYFDSVAADGLSNTVITFFRDPTSHTGLGSLWVMHDAVWPNGTRSSIITYVDQAQIIQCPGYTYGLWNSSTRSTMFSFNVTSDLKQASISISTAKTKGSWDITTLGPARYPDGLLYPNPGASTLFVPMCWWVEAMPAGIVQTSFEIAGSKFAFTGYGGVDYFAGSYIWDYICRDWYWMRGVVGPYSIVFWKFTSAIDNNTYTSAFLVQDGSVLFSTQNSENILATNPLAAYAKLTLLYGGKVSASMGANDTGYTLDFVEGTKHGGRSWHFDLQHENIGYQTDADINDMYTRFADSATGGQKGRNEYIGAMNSEQILVKVVYPIP